MPYNPGGAGGGGGSTDRVKNTINDTTANYLASKLVAGSNITLTTVNPGGNEQTSIAASGGGGGGTTVAVTAADTTPDYLNAKITAGAGITKTLVNPGGNEALSLSATNDKKVANTTNDTTPNFLASKLAAGSGITLTTLNPASNEQTSIAAATQTGDHKVLNTAADTTANYLASKLAAGTNIAITTLNLAGNEQSSIGITGQIPIANGGTAGTTATTARQNLITPSAAGYIIGLKGLWVSGTQLGCAAGECYIESLGYSLYGAPANITPSSPSNSTWYHVYAYSNSGTLTLEASTTAPVAFATPIGTARSKSGDTSRRYLYSALTDGAGAFRNFSINESTGIFIFKGVNNNATPFRVLSAGAATTATTFSCSGAVPVTASFVIVSFQQTTAAVIAFFSSGDITVSSTNFIYIASPGGPSNAVPTPCDASQQLSYLNSAGGGASYADIIGFYFSR